MKNIVAELNKQGIFHTVTKNGVKVFAGQADLDADGKKLLKTYYGFSDSDFTVPEALSDPFKNSMSDKVAKMAKDAKKGVDQDQDKVNRGM